MQFRTDFVQSLGVALQHLDVLFSVLRVHAFHVLGEEAFHGSVLEGEKAISLLHTEKLCEISKSLTPRRKRTGVIHVVFLTN
jgi:hypothetical protein